MVEGEARLYWTRDRHHVLVFGDGAFGTERSVLAGSPPPDPLLGAVFQWQNAANLFAGYGHDLSPAWRAELQGSVGYDRFLLLVRRLTVGPGIRWEPWDAPTTDGHLGLGVLAEQEISNAEMITGEDPLRNRVRGSTYASVGWTPSDVVTLLATAYAQPVLTDPTDLRVLGEIDLEVALGGGFSTGFEIEARYDSKPPETVDSIPALSRWNGGIEQTLEWTF